MPRFDPSSLNCTPATPILSDAAAFIVTIPEATVLFAGAVIDTVGNVVGNVTGSLSGNVVGNVTGNVTG